MIMHMPLNSTHTTDAPFARMTPLPPPPHPPPPIASANDNDTNIDPHGTTPGAVPTISTTVSGPATTTTVSTPPNTTTISTPVPTPTRALSTAEILSHLLPFFAPVPIPVRWPDLGDDAALRNLFVCLIGDPTLFVGSGVSSGGTVGSAGGEGEGEGGGVGVEVEHAGRGGRLPLARASSSEKKKEKKTGKEVPSRITEAKETSRQREPVDSVGDVCMEDVDMDVGVGRDSGLQSAMPAKLPGSSSLSSSLSLPSSSSATQIQTEVQAQQQQNHPTSTPRSASRCELQSGSSNAHTTTTPGPVSRSGSGRSMHTFSPVDWSKTKMNTTPVVKDSERGTVLSLSPHAKLILSPGGGAGVSASASTSGSSSMSAISPTKTKATTLSPPLANATAPTLSRSTTLSTSMSTSTSVTATMLPSGTSAASATVTNTSPTQVLAVQRSYTLPPPPEGSLAELRKMSLGTAFTDKVVYAEGAFGGAGSSTAAGSESGNGNGGGRGVDMVMGADAGERMLSPESEEFFSGEESDADGGSGRGGKKMRRTEGREKAESDVEMRTAPGASKPESSNSRGPGLAPAGMESAISGASSLSSLTSLPSSAAISASSSVSMSSEKEASETEPQSHSLSQAQLQSRTSSSPASSSPSSPVVMVDLTDVKFGPPKKKKPAPRLFLSPFKASSSKVSPSQASPSKDSPSKASTAASVSTLGSVSTVETMDINAPPHSARTPTPPTTPSPVSGVSGTSAMPPSATAMPFPESSQTTIEEESMVQDLIMGSGSQDLDDEIHQFSSPVRPQVSSGGTEGERKDADADKDVDDISLGVGSFSSLGMGVDSQIETALSHERGMDSQIETPSTPTRMADDGQGPETPSVSRYPDDGGWEDIVPSSCSPPTLKKITDKGKGKAVDEDTAKDNASQFDFPQYSSPLFTSPADRPFDDEDHPNLDSPSKPSQKSNPPSLSLSITDMTSEIVRAKQELNSPIHVPKPSSGGNDGLGGAKREYSYIPSVSPPPVKLVKKASSSQVVSTNASANAKRRQSSSATAHMVVDMDDLSPPPPSASQKHISTKKQKKKSLGKETISAKTNTIISISSGSEGEDVVEVKPEPKEKEKEKAREKERPMTQTATTMSQRPRPKPVPISRKPTAKLDVFAKPAAEVVDLTTPVKDVPKAKVGSRVSAAVQPPSPTPLASTSTSTSSKAKATSGSKITVVDDPKGLQPSQPEPEPEPEPAAAPVEYDSSPLSSEGEDEPAPPAKKSPPFDIKKYTAQLAAAADESDDAEIITVKKKKKPSLASSADGGLKRDPDDEMPPPGKLTRILAGKGKQSGAMTRVRKRKRSSGLSSVADEDSDDNEEEYKKPPLKRAKARNGSVASSATVERQKEREKSKPVLRAKTESVKGKEKEAETGKRYPLRSPRKESSLGGSSASASTPKKKRAQTVVWPKVEKPNFDLFVNCDLCELWYHIGCVGMEPGDVRLRPTELYRCPLCEVGATKEESPVKKSGERGEDNTDPRSRCSRGRHCLLSSIKKRRGRKSAAQLEAMDTEGAYDVEAFVGRYKKVIGGQGLTYEYLVKWLNYDYSQATWETIVQMGLTDPSTLLEQFEQSAMDEGIDLQNAGDTVLLKDAAEAGWNDDRAFVKSE